MLDELASIKNQIVLKKDVRAICNAAVDQKFRDTDAIAKASVQYMFHTEACEKLMAFRENIERARNNMQEIVSNLNVATTSGRYWEDEWRRHISPLKGGLEKAQAFASEHLGEDVNLMASPRYDKDKNSPRENDIVLKTDIQRHEYRSLMEAAELSNGKITKMIGKHSVLRSKIYLNLIETGERSAKDDDS